MVSFRLVPPSPERYWWNAPLCQVCSTVLALPRCGTRFPDGHATAGFPQL